MSPTLNRSRFSRQVNCLAAVLAILLLTSLISANLQGSESGNLQLGIHQVGSWHAPNDSNLIIEDHQKNQYQALLKPDCKGLKNAHSIAFISNGNNGLDKSSSVVLPNGKRCPFKIFSRKMPASEP